MEMKTATNHFAALWALALRWLPFLLFYGYRPSLCLKDSLSGAHGVNLTASHAAFLTPRSPRSDAMRVMTSFQSEVFLYWVTDAYMGISPFMP